MELPRIYGNDFDKIVYDDETPCVVIFSRKTCHVCNDIKPILAELGQEYKSVSFYYADVEEDANLFKRFSFKGVPQILFFYEGCIQAKLAGEVDEDDIEECLELILP